MIILTVAPMIQGGESMETFEELLEVGGPMILEELEPNEKVIALKESPEVLNPRYGGAAFAEISGQDASMEGLILLRDIGRNASRCRVGYVSRMGIVILTSA